MQNRARATRIEFWAFDLLYLDGRSLLRAKYRDRRKLLETLGFRWRPERSRPAARRRRRGAGVLAQARWEGVIAKKRDSTLSAGPSLGVVGQGQALEHPGSRHRRLARRRGRTQQRHRLAADGYPRRRRAALRRAGRHRLHRTRPGQPEEDAGAAAHRRISVRRKASHARRQGRDVRGADAGRRGPLQRMDVGRPAASTQLARAAAGQGTRSRWCGSRQRRSLPASPGSPARRPTRCRRLPSAPSPRTTRPGAARRPV